MAHRPHRSGLSPVQPAIAISTYRQALGRKLKPDEIANQVEGRREASIKAYNTERQYAWPRAQHMAYGRQWVDWNPKLGRWVPAPLERDRSQTRNHLRNRLELRLARQLSNRPHFSALPARPDQDSVLSARLAEWVLEHDWYALEMFLARFFATLSENLYGVGIIKVHRDPWAGDLDIDYKQYLDDDGVPIPEDALAEIGKLEPIRSKYRGENKVEAVHPAALLVPPWVPWPSFKYCPYLIQRVPISMETIKRRWGVDVGYDTQDAQLGTDFSTSLLLDIQRFTYHTYAAQDYGQNNLVLVDFYYEEEKDVSGFEFGKCYAVANGKLLNGPDGEPCQKYPFYLFPGGFPELGRFYPRAWIMEGIEPNVSYNQKRTKVHRWDSILFGPHILNPTTSGIPDDHFGGAFSILNYQAFGGVPQYMTPPPVPPEAYNSMQRDLEDMDMVLGLHGFARGQQQQGSPSAALAQTLIEADQSDLGPTITMHARAWEGVGYADLELHRKHTSEDDLTAIAGRGGYPEVITFKKSALRANVLLRVQEDSLQPVLKGARIQQTTQLIDRGLYGAPQNFDAPTRTFLLEHMGQPVGKMGIQDPEMMERRYAERENFRIVTLGQEVDIRPGLENDELHLRVHLERANMDDAESWDPQTLARLQQHIQQHQQSLQQQQQQQMQAQMQMAEAQLKLQEASEMRKEVTSKGLDAMLRETGEARSPGNGEPGRGTR